MNYEEDEIMFVREQTNASCPAYLLLGPTVLGLLLLLLALVAPVRPSSVLQGGGGRRLLLGGRVVSQLPSADLATVQAPLPGPVRLVLDGHGRETVNPADRHFMQLLTIPATQSKKCNKYVAS